jgi:hypothetical protein
MKLGLGLSIPGIAAMGGKPLQRLVDEAVVRIEPGTGFDDVGTANLSVTNNGVTTSGGAFVFDGSSYLSVGAAGDWDLGTTTETTLVLVVKYADPNGEFDTIFDTTTGAARSGVRILFSTADSDLIFDGVSSSTEEVGYQSLSTTPGAWNVVSLRLNSTQFTLRVNGTDSSPVNRPSGAVTPTAAAHIGADRGTTLAFTGEMLGFFRFDRALAVSELQIIESLIA